MKLNCTAGSIDDSNFSKPMPVIGLYIAAASLLCAILMAIDAGKGFWSKRYWIPTKYFSVNAASLTVLGVAIKLSVDLNSAMPSKVDQLAKLSTSAFLCTVLANILPSLGRLADGELLANTTALSILVITSIVNLCIQLNTGVIHAFRAAHIVMIVMMSLILHECIATASSLPALKIYFNFMFEQIRERYYILEFENYLSDVSASAQSSCPQFVMAGSLRSFSVAILGLVSALTFFVILIASIIHKHKFLDLNTCNGESDYKWTVLGILIVQTIAVVVGLVAPISRLVSFIGVAIEDGLRRRHEKEEHKNLDSDAKLESYRWQISNGIIEDLNFSYFEDRQKWSSRVHLIKYISRQLLFLFKFLCESAFTTKIIIFIFRRNDCLRKNSFGPFLLHGRGEEKMIRLTQKICSLDTQRYIDAGKKRIPQNLVKFLKEHLSRDWSGVASFVDYNNKRLPSIEEKEIVENCCWALAVVTLTSVATAIPNISNPTLKERLIDSVNEGLVYIKLVEDNAKGEHFCVISRAAATKVWIGLDRERSWLNINLQELARQNTSPINVLLDLERKTNDLVEDDILDQIEKQKKKPYEAVTSSAAAYILKGVCQVLLQKNSLNVDSGDVIFKKISDTIADILGACFTNLKPCIDSICKSCPIENRRETVYRMLKVFGETEVIMEILEEEGRNIPPIPTDKRRFLGSWRKHFRQQTP